MDCSIKERFYEDLDLKGWESFRLGEERRNPVLGRRTDLIGSYLRGRKNMTSVKGSRDGPC